MTEPEATVLVVDDDPMLREVLAEQLEVLGYGVATAASAEAAVRMLGDGLQVDLILTDVNLGRTSGVELCAWLKADPRYADTPVILVSGADDQYARRAGFAAGAVHFFAKPFSLADLEMQVGALLGARSPGR